MGTECSMGTEFQFGRTESSGDGWWGWLHNSVNALNATELDAYSGKFYLCYLYLTTTEKVSGGGGW